MTTFNCDMTINQRITDLINTLYSGNKRAFSIAINVSPAVIENIVGKRQSAPSYEITSKIISSIDNISIEWLMTGKGNMLKDQAKEYIEKKEVSNIISEPNTTYNNDEFKAKYYKKLEEENEWLKKIIAEKEELLDMYKTGKIVFVEPKKGALK